MSTPRSRCSTAKHRLAGAVPPRREARPALQACYLDSPGSPPHRRILFFGRGGPNLLARSLADVGPLPVEHWIYREPYFQMPGDDGLWPPWHSANPPPP